MSRRRDRKPPPRTIGRWSAGCLLATALLGASSGEGAADPASSAVAAYEQGRYPEARAALRPMALSGDPEAQFMLGQLYDLGRGVERDPVAAFQWYLSAARIGHAESQFNVAVMLDAGRGAPRDRREAAIWYARAASLGDPRAAFNLGMLFEAGEGAPKDLDLARAWYAAAASIPASVARREALEAVAAPAAATPPAAPRPSETTLVLPAREDRPATAQLVWFPGEDAPPCRFFIEVAALEDGPPRPIVSEFVDRSAYLAPLPDPTAARYAYRVLAVSAAQGHYSSSGWRLLPAPGPAPSLAQGSERHGLTRYDVTARYPEGDVEAEAWAEDLARDLRRANIWVRREALAAPPDAPGVAYAFPQDRAAAEDLATLLSLGPEAVSRRPVTASTPPGALIVSLRGAGAR